LGICHTTFKKFYSRYLQKGSLTRPSNAGKIRKTSPHDVRSTETSVKHARFVTVMEIPKPTVPPSLIESMIRSAVK
jgi:hypothetical protein